MGNVIRVLLLLLLYYSHVGADPWVQTGYSENDLPQKEKVSQFEIKIAKREIAENEIGGVNENGATVPTVVDNSIAENATGESVNDTVVESDYSKSSVETTTATSPDSTSSAAKGTVTERYSPQAGTSERVNSDVQLSTNESTDNPTMNSSNSETSSTAATSSVNSSSTDSVTDGSRSYVSVSKSSVAVAAGEENTTIVDNPISTSLSEPIQPTPSATVSDNDTFSSNVSEESSRHSAVKNTSSFDGNIVVPTSTISSQSRYSNSDSLMTTILNETNQPNTTEVHSGSTKASTTQTMNAFETRSTHSSAKILPSSTVESFSLSSTSVQLITSTLQSVSSNSLIHFNELNTVPGASKMPTIQSSMVTSTGSNIDMTTSALASFSTKASLSTTSKISNLATTSEYVSSSFSVKSSTLYASGGSTINPDASIDTTAVINTESTATVTLEYTDTNRIESTTNTATVEPTSEPRINYTSESKVNFTSDPTIEPTSEPQVQTTSELTNRRTSGQTEKSVVESTEGTATEVTIESTRKPTDAPTGESTEEPTSEPIENPRTEKPTSKSTVEMTNKPTIDLTSKPTVEPPVESTVEITSEPKVSMTQEPTVEPTSEPKVNPTVEPGSETDDETDAEPTNDSDGDSAKPDPEMFNPDAFAEPGPDWPVAKLEWKEAWHFHVYFFGALFALLAVYCLTCICRLWNMDHLLKRNYFLSLNILVLFVCTLRAVYLLVDGYNSSGMYPIIVNHLLYSTVFPCLTAMFSILFYALMLATRVRLLSKKIQKLWVLLVIIAIHFGVSLSTDIIIGLTGDAVIMLFVCQLFFMLWGMIMFIGYLVIFKRLYSGAVNRQRSTHEHKRSIAHSFHDKPRKLRNTLGLAVKVTLAAAFFGVACVAFELYGMFGVYGVLGNYKVPEPWPWWVYHFILRTLEFSMCASVVYVATQPLKYIYKGDERKWFSFLKCKPICCRDKLHSSDDTSSVGLDHYTATDSDQLGWMRKFKRVSSPDDLYPPHTAEQYKDPDATLLVRKVKNKPSMLVVEDGFVRIRREDELIQTYPYEVESDIDSAHSSSDMNRTSPSRDNFSNVSEVNPPQSQVHTADNVETSLDYSGVANYGYTQDDVRTNYLQTVDGHVFVSGIEDSVPYETDVDIEVTDSENSETGDSVGDGARLPDSNISDDDIFRPLSMIDLAASMESKLERAFHSSAIADLDTISHSSLPLSLEVHSADSRESVDNEPMIERYLGNRRPTDCAESMSASAVLSETQSSSLSSRLLPSPVRRCNSAESKVGPKSKLFEKKKYFSLCDMEQVGHSDMSSSLSDYDTRCTMNTKDLITEL